MTVMKGILKVIKTGNGTIKCRIDYKTESTGKNKSVNLEGTKFPLECNDQEIEFEFDKNRKPRIVSGIPNIDQFSATGHCEVSEGRQALAPYNFVPFPEKVIEVTDKQDFSRFDPERFTGKIELTLAPKSPLFIRDGEKDKSVDFFHIEKDRPVIPGSSLRGLFRSMIEIVSWSKPGAINDIKPYYRAMADQCKPLKNRYSQIMATRQGNASKIKAKGGILKKTGNRYVIYPVRPHKGETVFKISQKSASRISNGKKDIFPDIFFKPDENIVTQINSKNPGSGYIKGYLVCSGDAPSKNPKNDWIIPAEINSKKNQIPLSEKEIQSYQDDKKRSPPFEKRSDFEERPGFEDILESLEKNPLFSEGVPVFYIQEASKVRFGYTGMFRLPYDHSIGEIAGFSHPPLDFAENLFGMVDEEKEICRAGRVFFEDAQTSSHTEYQAEPKVITVLGSPNPTTFQHYLKQENDQLENLHHYDSKDAKLRGAKLYWHKQKPNAPLPPTDNDKIKVEFIPVTFEKGGFKTTIRFENLTRQEVGALLFIANLPENKCHHIGMAKPYGYGSIKTNGRVFIIDLESRYGRFTSGFDSKSGLQKRSEDEFMEYFETWMLLRLKEIEPDLKIKSLWEHPRMVELSAMLQMPLPNKDKNWDRRRRYFKIKPNEYQYRKVLPLASQVDLYDEIS